MIPYEELCQALDRFNARRRNEAEMTALEQEPQDPYAATDPSAAPVADEMSEAPVIQDQPPTEDSSTAEDPAAAMAAAIAEGADAQEGGFAEQAPEDTHEIDVEDVEIDERLSEDKLP
jgi:hypothetical protein